jgi:cytidylate kinase
MSPAIHPVITIDGPAGSGKSEVAKLVAEALRLLCLDTGSLYRAVAVLCIEAGRSLDDNEACGEIAYELIQGITIPQPGHVHYFERDLSEDIRTPAATDAVPHVSALPLVRQALFDFQVSIGRAGYCVIEGRDAGSTICPQAGVKIYLTASVEERARRRNETTERIAARDHRDSTRPDSPLREPEGAITIDSTKLTELQVVEVIVDLYRQRIAA